MITFAEAARQQVKVSHPDNPNLNFLYGVILSDGKDANNNDPVANVMVFHGQVGCDDVTTWKNCLHYRPFMRGNYRSSVVSFT